MTARAHEKQEESAGALQHQNALQVKWRSLIWVIERNKYAINKISVNVTTRLLKYHHVA